MLTRCEQAKMRLRRLASFKNTSESEIEIDDATKISQTSSNKKSLFSGTQSKDIGNNQSRKSPKWYYDAIDTENLLLTLTDGDCELHDNLYYFPEFLTTLTRLMGQLPLWSNVMKKTFQSEISAPTSSNVEVYFKMVKRYLCQINTKSERYRIDEFIVKHSESISGQLKTASSKLNEKKKIPKEKKSIKNDDTKMNTQLTKGINNESIFSDTPSMLENWRGLAIGKKEKKKREKIKRVTLLRNGSLTTCAGKNTIVLNTCAFDAVAQAIAVGVADNYALNSIINTNENDEYFKLIKMMILDNDTLNVYKLREEILKKHFETKFIGDKTYVSCECNVAYIFENILWDKIYSADITELCTNFNCPINNVRRKCAFLPLDLNKDTLSEAANTMLNSDSNMSICRHSDCDGIKTINYNLKNIAVFEPNPEVQICINDLPQNISLKGTVYHLLSVIEFVPSATPTDVGHYKSHCRRGSKWQCYDDMSSKITVSYKKMTAHCLIYAKKC